MQLNEKEVLRYLGFRGKPADAMTLQQISEIGEMFLSVLQPRSVHRRYTVKVTENAVLLDGWYIKSEKLARHLRGCSAAYLFAATLGMPADRMIRRYAAMNMAKGAIAHAVCNALIESYCDGMQAVLAETEEKDGLFLKPRFSPGYGDFSLESQTEIFQRLQCEKSIGITLTDTLLMVPAKSVTAVIGITAQPECKYRECQSCSETECAFRAVQ